VLFVIQNGKKNQQSEVLGELISLRLANVLQIYSTVSCWIFGFIEVYYLSAQTNTFLFYFNTTTTTFFPLSILFFSFISTAFMLQPGYNRVSKPIKSQMKVKYANANVNHFKMFAGRIKM